MTQVLIVAAHPDDEVLGVGGAVARHVADGDDVCALILAEGATSRYAPDKEKAQSEIESLREAARAAARVLGCQPPMFAGLPDNRLDSVDLLDLVKKIEEVIEQVRPSTIYTHHAGDLNVDHELAARAVLTACRPLPVSSVTKIYGFETVSNTEWAAPGDGSFKPNHFVDISPFLKQKLDALSHYEVEMRSFPHPRSYEAIKALASWRGASAGMEAAEAFTVVRQLSRNTQ